MDGHLRAVPAEDYDQVVRLAAFRERHPEVLVRDLGRGGIWQATIKMPSAELTLTRLHLKDLLDELGRLPGDVLGG